ncbi:MAG: hypothetical protein U0Z75_03305 [Deinococcaceae bacterium]
MKHIHIALWISTALALSACGGSTTPTPTCQTAAGCFGNAGGTYTSADQDFKIEIPAGTFPTNTTLNVQKVDNPPTAPEGYAFLNKVYKVDLATTPKNTMSFKFKDPQVQTLLPVPSTSKIYRLDPGKTWMPVATTSEGGYISTPIRDTLEGVLFAAFGPTCETARGCFTSAGGTLTSTDGKAVLTVPRDTFSTNTQVQLSETQNPGTPPTGTTAVGKAYTVVFSGDSTKKVTLSLSYGNTPPARVKLYRRIEAAWVAQTDAVVDEGSLSLEIPANSSGTFALFASTACNLNNGCVGQEGGTLTQDNLKLTIPKNALSAETLVQISEAGTVPALPANMKMVGRNYQIGLSGAQLNQPMNLSVTYTDAQLESLIGSQAIAEPTLYKVDGTRWMPVQSTTNGKTISTDTQAEGTYALLGMSTSGNPDPGQSMEGALTGWTEGPAKLALYGAMDPDGGTILLTEGALGANGNFKIMLPTLDELKGKLGRNIAHPADIVNWNRLADSYSKVFDFTCTTTSNISSEVGDPTIGTEISQVWTVKDDVRKQMLTTASAAGATLNNPNLSVYTYVYSSRAITIEGDALATECEIETVGTAEIITQVKVNLIRGWNLVKFSTQSHSVNAGTLNISAKAEVVPFAALNWFKLP